MIRLKSFGNIDLRGADGELRGILTQPKRLALLLRLAAERPGTFLRRDTLLAMLWPELDTAGARNALRQALFHLRRELGDGVLVNRGDDEVGLDARLLRSDIAEFEEAAAGGRWDTALDLVAGELAPGLYVSDASGFEEWLEEKRADLHRRAAAGAWQLAREAEASGAHTTAAAWARRAVQHQPEDESGVRKLLELLSQAGDTAGAVQVYAAFEERLRREYGVAPAPETVSIRQAIVAVAPVVGAVPASGGTTSAAGAAPHEAYTPAVPRIRSWQWLLAGGAIVLVLAATVATWRGREAGEGTTDPARLLVTPFRTAGGDTVLAALSIGLVDLTNARLSGASMPRPVDPDVGLRAVAEARAVHGATESEQLVAAARQAGAGLILGGTLLREGGRVVLAPVVIRTANGASTPLPQVGGPIDSLSWIVDRMAASLLSTFAGEGGADAPGLASIPLPALRAYLDGRQLMREGRVTDAMAALARALELDSTFALAARDYAEALDWAGEDPTASAKQRAWMLRDRLGVRDRAILVALVGRHFPAPSTIRESVQDWEEAIRWAPDRSAAWFGLGDMLFHFGDMAGIAGAQERARNAFDRALALDSAAVPVLFHRIEMAAREGEVDVVRRLLPRVETGRTPGDAEEFLRWRAAVALGDSAELRRIRDRFGEMSAFALTRIGGWGQVDATGMEDPARALAILQRMERTGSEAGHLVTQASALAGNRGQFDTLRSIVRAYGMSDTPTAGLFYAGDDEVGPRFEALARAVAVGTDTSLTARDDVVFWRLWEGDPADRPEVVRYLKEADNHPVDLTWAANACLASARLGTRDAVRRMRWADSLASLVSGGESTAWSMLTLSRCHEALGDRPGALAILARRPLDPVYGPRALAGYLYHEGRLALLEGDRARAIRAWRQFLALRDAPDSALRPQVDMLRRAVDSLSRN